MKVALVSLNQSWENKPENQKKVNEVLNLIFQKEKQVVDLVVFPEMTLTGFTMNSHMIQENSTESETVSFFEEKAKYYGVTIAFGVVFIKEEKATNNLVVVNSEGNLIGQYAKIHPFSYAQENEYYESGQELVSCKIGKNNIGLTICYDLRFPELYQGLSKDCNIIINIANWPEKRVSHWNTLLKARAIENQSFVIGVNRTGKDGNGLQYQKSSQIISPEGNIVGGKEISSEISLYSINTEEVDNYRKTFPVKNDRKTDLYKKIL